MLSQFAPGELIRVERLALMQVPLLESSPHFKRQMQRVGKGAAHLSRSILNIWSDIAAMIALNFTAQKHTAVACPIKKEAFWNNLKISTMQNRGGKKLPVLVADAVIFSEAANLFKQRTTDERVGVSEAIVEYSQGWRGSKGKPRSEERRGGKGGRSRWSPEK